MYIVVGKRDIIVGIFDVSLAIIYLKTNSKFGTIRASYGSSFPINPGSTFRHVAVKEVLGVSHQIVNHYSRFESLP
jgi:hypothetical protein